MPGDDELRVQVSEPVLDRGGAEVVADAEVLAEADLQPERGRPVTAGGHRTRLRASSGALTPSARIAFAIQRSE